MYSSPASSSVVWPWQLALLLLVLGAACVPAVLPPPSTAEIPVLEAQLAAGPVENGIRFRLAEAYRRSGQAERSAALLEPVVDRDPDAAFFLGIVREDQSRYPEALRLYQTYLERGASAQLRQRARDRLAWLGRLELQAAARAALAREQQLAATTPVPSTVGVFPFLMSSNEPDLAPLGTALAELLTTDLGQTDRLVVLERARVRELLDEIGLVQAGLVDPATAARGGRLLGAGTIVQGRIDGGSAELGVEAAVLRVPGGATEAAPLRERDAVQRIFDIEKRLALGIYERAGIQLTAAERQRVLRQPTTNVQALLALGFGLEAQDAGRFDEARDHFARAVQLDPGFSLARQRLDEADSQLRAQAETLLNLGDLGLRQANILRRQAMFRTMELLVPDPSARDAFSEVTGTEGAAREGTAEIIIRRPGSGQ